MQHSPGPWTLCPHLASPEGDAACPCGYRGGIYGGDDKGMVCEMGSTVVPGEEGLEAPRYPRAVELANARLIAAAPDLYRAAEMLFRGDALQDPKELYEAWRAMREAVAKARGID